MTKTKARGLPDPTPAGRPGGPFGVCVFCGSRDGVDRRFTEAAAETGRLIAEAGRTLVYGGGRVGLMGVTADAALKAGGRVEGVLPERLAGVELRHEGITELHVVPDMHTRKAMMAERSDAFLALPGGLGTLEELFEIITWRQIGYHAKPVALLNTAGFWEPLLAAVEAMAAAGFIYGDPADVVAVYDTPAEAVAAVTPAIDS